MFAKLRIEYEGEASHCPLTTSEVSLRIRCRDKLDGSLPTVQSG